MLEFSTPPTDAQVLAFLRKYDLRPSEATDVYKTMVSQQKCLVSEASPLPSFPVEVAEVSVLADALPSESRNVDGALADEMVEPLDDLDPLGESAPGADAAASPPPLCKVVPASSTEPLNDMGLDAFLNFINDDTCAACNDDIIGDDRVFCNCGNTVVHPLCFKLCKECS